jgi:hypothetical protein
MGASRYSNGGRAVRQPKANAAAPWLVTLAPQHSRSTSNYTRLRFHVEHIVARQHGGGDDAENLALACHLCNAHKGPNLTGIDPNSGEITPLFHPRKNRWKEHFANVAGAMIGLTAIGRVTVVVLAMNLPARVDART